jgi:tetratricopeptide (TPR) repeat protein
LRRSRYEGTSPSRQADALKDAEQYLAQLRQSGDLASDRLLNWETRIAAGEAAAAADPFQRQDQLQRALQSAEELCAKRPDVASNWSWLARLRFTLSRFAEPEARASLEAKAEEAFQRAVKLAPADLRIHADLFGFCLQTGRRQQAEQALEALAREVKPFEANCAMALGAGYESLGDLARAEARYREAMRLEPKNAPALESLVALLKRTGRQAEAEKVLRDSRQSSPDSEFTRLALAQFLVDRALAATGEEEARLWNEVEGLLNQGGSVLDRRLRATFLYRRGGRDHMASARKLLEELIRDPQNGTEFDHLLLARICEDESKQLLAEGKDAAAQAQIRLAQREYLQLVQRPQPLPDHLLIYVGFLLRNGRQAEAAPWRAKFEQIGSADPQRLAKYVELLLQAKLWKEAQPSLEKLEAEAKDSPGITALRVRWLDAAGRTEQIEPAIAALADRLVKEAAGDANREVAAYLTIGNLYASVRQFQTAESWYRRVLEKMPHQYASLAMALAKQGRMTEAIRVCSEAAKTDQTPRPAIVLSAALVSGKPTADDYRLAEPLLIREAAQHKDSADLLLGVANVRVVQNRTDEAIALYRQVLQLRPKDVVVLNNLATLLAERPGGAGEALALVDRAIDLAGPNASLLDTKGMALVYGGKAAEAVAWLKTAASGADSDPRFDFHLAVAYDRAGKTQEARQALSAARSRNLADQILTGKDQELLAELESRLLKGQNGQPQSVQ